jgi:hypothetical protein
MNIAERLRVTRRRAPARRAIDGADQQVKHSKTKRIYCLDDQKNRCEFSIPKHRRSRRFLREVARSAVVPLCDLNHASVVDGGTAL